MHNADNSNLVQLATRYSQAGQLVQAGSICEKVLAGDPNHVNALHLLGVIARQMGHHDKAVTLIGRAIELDPDVCTFHVDVGLALQALGRIDAAVAHYMKALSLRADYPEAHMALGNAVFRQGKLAEATAQYEQILSTMPNCAEALYMLGNALQLQGRLEDAVIQYRKAVALKPDFAELHNNLGNALREQGKLDEAVTHCRRSLELNPRNVEAYNNLALVLRRRGFVNEAVELCQRALTLRPNFLEARQNLCYALIAQGRVEDALDEALLLLDLRESPEHKDLFVQSVRAVSDLRQLRRRDAVRKTLSKALAEPWARPVDLAHVAINLVKSDIATGSRSDSASHRSVHGSLKLREACSDELLRCILESVPVCDLQIEQFLTSCRLEMLELATEASIYNQLQGDFLLLACALARQCYINEYVFPCTGGELEWAHRLRSSLVFALEADRPILGFLLAVIGSYFPLHSVPVADTLLNGPWPDCVANLIKQQILEHHQELAFRSSIPRLTDIRDQASSLVRQQYEENPYPRWVKTAPVASQRSIGNLLHQLFPTACFNSLNDGGTVEILVAGCGTGQGSIELAQRFPEAQVLAVDLSFTSLCYAERKARELGLNNVRHAQADILELGSTGKTFDVIEAMGVLHHLADPFAGWRVLLSLLRPGGFMRLGIYSKAARRNVTDAQRFVSMAGYRATAADIRRCRQDLARLDDAIPFKRRIIAAADFYSTSSCRDLLFHVQEHPLELLDIDRFLIENRLRFLGFNIDYQVTRRFCSRFNEEALTDVHLWHVFERENPDVFVRMYQFWVQKD